MSIFKGVWIPTELIEIDISWTKRILIAEISQLEMYDKGCVASNGHFAQKLKLTKQAVSKALNELEKDGFITIDNAQTKRNFGRKITINFSKSAINFSKSEVHESGESKENKQVNKSINTYEGFLKLLKEQVSIKSKVTKTKDGEIIFKTIDGKEKLMNDYIAHQLEAKNFSKRITAFMEDYSFHTSVDTSSKSNDENWGWK